MKLMKLEILKRKVSLLIRTVIVSTPFKLNCTLLRPNYLNCG